MTEKYFTKQTSVPTRPGCWNYLLVEIFQKGEDGSETKIGEYTRNYSGFLNTFYPFVKNGKEYALFSRRYVCTEIMELPSCNPIAIEKEPEHGWGFGFCPTGFYVPDNDEKHGLVGNFGFVCGCIWGDDTSWKIEYLDLSKIEEGIIGRDARFGYIELLGGGEKLKEAIDMDDYNAPIGCKEEESYRYINIACMQRYDLDAIEKKLKDAKSTI